MFGWIHASGIHKRSERIIRRLATVQESQPIGKIAVLQEASIRRSLGGDALSRLTRNRLAVIGALIIVLSFLVAIFAPIIAPKDYDDAILADSNATPRWLTSVFPNMKPLDEGGYMKINESYPLGADALGRDLLSRIIYGSRVSLGVAVVGPILALSIGLIVGIVAGYEGGKLDNLLMRFVDIMYAFPTYLLIILLMAFFRTGFSEGEPGTLAYTLGQFDAAMGGLLFVFIGIGLTSWMGMARLARGQTLAVRQNEYIEAARAVGAKTPHILLRHVLPNIIGPLIVAETLAIPGYISYEAFLSFIGLGVTPPTPSWGGMIAEGARVIQPYPYQAIFPALALALVMFSFNFLGDGLRDALDPRLRGVD
jgi:oligopeptide transport system permease protein